MKGYQKISEDHIIICTYGVYIYEPLGLWVTQEVLGDERQTEGDVGSDRGSNSGLKVRLSRLVMF
jgi:hypothetical protein